jgi:hypothetical protein
MNLPQEKPQASREISLEMTPEEMGEWKQHPGTVKVLRFLQEIREDYREQMASGQTLNLSSVEQTALLTSRLSGVIFGVNLTLALRPNSETKEEPRKTGYEPTV